MRTNIWTHSAAVALALLGAGPCIAVEYEYRSSGNDPFVPFYSSPVKSSFSSQTVPASRRFVLKGIWKASDAPWKAIVGIRSDEAVNQELSGVETQPLSVAVGDQLESGIKVVGIEEQTVWVMESIELADGRVFQKKSRISFDEEM